MFQMHAADRNPIDTAEAGDIVACIGVKDALTGRHAALAIRTTSIILERRPTFPEPVISMSIEPKTGRRQAEARRGPHDAQAFARTRRSRPSYDEETGQTIIAGMGELHLEILRMRTTRDYKVDVIVGKPPRSRTRKRSRRRLPSVSAAST